MSRNKKLLHRGIDYGHALTGAQILDDVPVPGIDIVFWNQCTGERHTADQNPVAPTQRMETFQASVNPPWSEATPKQIIEDILRWKKWMEQPGSAWGVPW